MTGGWVVERDGYVSPTGGACGTRFVFTVDAAERPWTGRIELALRFARECDGAAFRDEFLSAQHAVVPYWGPPA